MSLHRISANFKKERIFLNDSREFQEVDPVCGGRLSHVPSKPAVILSPRGWSSCDQSIRPEERNPHGISGDVFGTPFASVNTVSTSCGRVPHSLGEERYVW